MSISVRNLVPGNRDIFLRYRSITLGVISLWLNLGSPASHFPLGVYGSLQGKLALLLGGRDIVGPESHHFPSHIVQFEWE